MTFGFNEIAGTILLTILVVDVVLEQVVEPLVSRYRVWRGVVKPRV